MAWTWRPNVPMPSPSAFVSASIFVMRCSWDWPAAITSWIFWSISFMFSMSALRAFELLLEGPGLRECPGLRPDAPADVARCADAPRVAMVAD